MDLAGCGGRALESTLTERGLERLELGHLVNNSAARAFAVHAGFIKDGPERGELLVTGQRIDVDTYGRLR